MQIRCNGITFRAKPLEPFGLELRRREGEPLPLQPWIRRDVEEIVDLTREHALVIIRNATRTQRDAWTPIPPSSETGTTQIPHQDFHGKEPVLLWLSSQRRSPIGFVRTIDAAMAVRARRDDLKISPRDDALDTDFQRLIDLRQELENPADSIDVNRLHAEYKYLRTRAGDEYGAVLPPDVLLNRRKRLAEIDAFARSFLRTIEPRTYVQTGSRAPRTGILADNGQSPGHATGVLHFGIPDPSIGRQQYLLRAHISRIGALTTG